MDELMTPRPSLGDMPKSSVDEIRGEVGVVGLETLFRDSRLPARSLGWVGGGTLAVRLTLRLPPVRPSCPSFLLGNLFQILVPKFNILTNF
jgi:hypothetical protein